jgi:hypothetical protein
LDRGHVVVHDARSVRAESWVDEYYKVERPKVPVLVNLYKRVGEKLQNVNVRDELAVDEEVSAGTAVRLKLRSVRIGRTVCACVVVEREFVHQLYWVITMEDAPRVFVGSLRSSTQFQDLFVLESTAEETLALERTRRENWTSRALYHVPGRGVWVRGPTGLMRRYVEETYGAASTEEIEFSKVENAEEAEAKRRIPVADGYFVECDHGLVRPWGWLVTLRRVSEESTALVAKRTTTGFGILPGTEAEKAVEALKAMDAERSGAERSSADGIRGAGGKRVFGIATVAWKENKEHKRTKEINEIEVPIGEHTHVYGVGNCIGAGSYNFVFAPRVNGADLEGVVIRLTKPGKPRPSREAFEREAMFMRELGAIGVGPEVYATLEVQLEGKLLLGFAMERFERTLSEIPKCPSLMRKVFVEADGETALVDLYVRSSELIRCTDTKPGNVVVRFGTNGYLRLAMIDVAPDFCAEHELTYADPENGKSFGVNDLEAGLASKSPRYIAAGISLLVHCVQASSPGNAPYGFGYARIAACLMRHLKMLWVELSATHWNSAMKTIDAYFGDKDYTLKESDISVRLWFALRGGRLIQLCRTLGEGDLYESAALKFRASEYTISSEIKTSDGLVRELEENGPWTTLACNIEGCPHNKPEHARFGVWV